MEEKITFVRSDGVVFKAGAELVISDVATARCENRVFLVRVFIGKMFAERLRYDIFADEGFCVIISNLSSKRTRLYLIKTSSIFIKRNIVSYQSSPLLFK